MKLALGPLLVFAAGCSMRHGPSKDSVLVVADEVVADVSSDQSLLASYAKAALAGPGPLGGTLVVRPLPLADPVFPPVDGAFGATFGAQGTTLLYFTGATTGLDASAPVDFGNGWVWSPALGTPVSLQTGTAMAPPDAGPNAGFVTLWTAAPDHSVILFLLSETPAAGVGGAVRMLRVADCAAGACPTTVISNQNPYIARIALAPDLQHAAYQEEIKNADGSRFETVTLVNLADGTTTRVATTPVPSFIQDLGDLFSFSPDGSLIATVAETNNGALQSIVASTATGAQVPWTQQPGDLFTTQVGFSDLQTVFVAAVDTTLSGQIWSTTVDTSAPFRVPGSGFTISHTYPGTERYLGYRTEKVGVLPAKGQPSFFLVDLQNPTTDIPLATLGSGTLTFSEDVSSAFTYEGFQPGPQPVGTLVQIALPSGKTSTIAPDVYTGGVSFARGSSKILYFPTPDTRRSSGQAIVEWDGTGTQLEGFALNYVTVDNPPTLFWTLADPRALYRRPLP